MALGYISVPRNMIWGGGVFGAIRLGWQHTPEKEFFKSVERLSQEKFAKLHVGKATGCR